MKKLLDKKNRWIVAISALSFILLLIVISVSSIKYTTIGGVKYNLSAREVAVSGSDFSELSDYSFLNAFKNMETLDLRGSHLSEEKYELIVSQLDNDVNIIWDVPFGDSSFSCDAEELTLTEASVDGNVDHLQYFHNLKSVTAENFESIALLNEVIQAVRQNNPDAGFNYSANLYGVPVDSSTEAVCLNDIEIDDVTPVELATELFPNIKKYEMCDCGLSDDIMGSLREKYPQIEFVWMLHILDYNIRTDVQCFSTLCVGWRNKGDENDFSPLFKYCTELRALDLGHWSFRDISEIRNLKKLQALIFYANGIKDVSPLADLPDLMYLDLRHNYISDVSPLAKLQNLEYCALGNNPIKNAEVLVACQKMERLHISSVGLPMNVVIKLQKGLPKGCEFKYSDKVTDNWSADDKDRQIKNCFRKWKTIKEYHRYDDIVYY